MKLIISGAKDAGVMLKSLRDLATTRRDRAHSDRVRFESSVDLTRTLTPAEDAIYFAAFESGLATAYTDILSELANYEAREE